MKSKSIIILFLLVFMIVISVGSVSADDLQAVESGDGSGSLGATDSGNVLGTDLETTDSGEVSGDVDVVSVNPWTTNGQLQYNISSNAKEIKSAQVYVNVYSGSAQNTYGCYANVSLKTANGENQIASEYLWNEEGSADGTVYTINDHTIKCYSDYQMHYDITDALNGLNGTEIAIKVNTFKMPDKQFDGRIKMIALILAYDDGDYDQISYWINAGQAWTKTNTSTIFATSSLTNVTSATLYDVMLSSSLATFRLNNNLLYDPDVEINGNYYKYYQWDVTNKLTEGQNTEVKVLFSGATSEYSSIKNVLTVLKAKYVPPVEATVSLATEYADTCFAGTVNALTIKASSTKSGKYVIELLADGVVVNSTEVDLVGGVESTVYLTDANIRPVNETTVNGAVNDKVNYTVNVKYEDSIVANASKVVPILYDGYLGKEFAYNATYMEDFAVYTVNGDIVVDLGNSTYSAAGVTNRIDGWTVSLPSGSEFTNAFVYVAYNWDKSGATGPVFDTTFNNVTVAPVAHYRDQSNLGNSGVYGYGLFVYDVTGLIGDGENKFVLNKESGKTAVYPSALIYMYNTTGSNILKTIYMANGADLLYASKYNDANRFVSSDYAMFVDTDNIASAELYVFAGGAQAGEGNIEFNGEEYADVWSGTSYTLDIFSTDVTDSIADVNDVSFVSTGGTILALQQFIVTESHVGSVSFATEYSNTCFAGTVNVLTITASSNKNGKYVIELLADGVVVNSTEVDLVDGVVSAIYLTDSAIRPVNETTVNGAVNDKVNYTVNLKYEGNVLDEASKLVPILYDGYLGKEFAYNATYMEDFAVYTVNGDIVVDLGNSTYSAAGVTNRTDGWTVSLPSGSEFTNAFVYVAYNWDKSGATGPVFDTKFNDVAVVPVAHYRDQSNLGSSGVYGYGLFVYDVTELIKNGENIFVLNKESGKTAVYPSALIYMYNTTNSNFLKTIYMANGADLLYASSYNLANRFVSSDYAMSTVTDYLVDADLYVFAGGAQAGEGNIVFNGDEYTNVWSGTSYTLDIFTTDVTDSIADVNDISFVSTGGTILALQQFIVTKSAGVDVSVATEYANTCFAGTVNVLTIKTSSNKDGKYVVELLADGVVVNSTEVDLVSGVESTIYLTDANIRPVNETTVNGAVNDKVNYAVNVWLDDTLVGKTSNIVPILYDGYLGKEFAYNATYMEDFAVYTVNGNIVIDLGNSTYNAAGITNITDGWTVTLPSDSEFTNAFIYVSYNWDKSGATGPVFDTKFNDVAVVPVAHYRDQSNLGNSGVYGYGLFVYDVTELIKNGENIFVLNKESGKTAVYPSALIYMYNTTGSNFLKTIYMANGADLLYASSYNLANRFVSSDYAMSTVTDNVVDAKFYVFAGGAQAGEGNIVFNGDEYTNVWSGTSYTLDIFSTDVTDSIADVNDVSFVSTGGTILALQQLIVVTSDLYQSTIDVVSVDGDFNVKGILRDLDGNRIGDATVFYTISGGERQNTTTNANGEFIITATDDCVITFEYAGDTYIKPTVFNFTLKALKPVRQATDIDVEEQFTRYANDFNAGERGGMFYFTLKDGDGNIMANKSAKIGINGVIYSVVTDKDGKAGLQINLAKSTAYTYAIAYLGDDEYNASFAVSKLNLVKKPITITPKKTSYTFTASAKNKYVEATLSTIKNPYDGKMYLSQGKKVTLTINGKTYTATAGKNGAIKFNIGSTTKKGTYKVTIKYAGDGTYEAGTSKQITIKIS